MEKCVRICRWSMDLGASVFWNPGLRFVFSCAMGNTSDADSLKARVNIISKLGLTMPCYVAFVWIGICGVPRRHWMESWKCGRRHIGICPKCGWWNFLVWLCWPTLLALWVSMPVARHPVGTHLDCSFTWLSLWTKSCGAKPGGFGLNLF